MKLLRIILAVFTVSALAVPLPAADGADTPGPDAASKDHVKLFEKCELDGLLDYDIFANALECLDELEFNNENLLTIIDYTRPSTEKRLFVIDLVNGRLLFHTLVAHGKNSGLNIANSFSNTSNSLQSSLGFYTTGEPYLGKHGYSLRLDGLETGINDHARERAIVIHGAPYVSEDFIEAYGRLGRSWGCPALPTQLAGKIIDLIKNGSCLYIHADDEDYLECSVLAD
jgi:hypothetical protein